LWFFLKSFADTGTIFAFLSGAKQAYRSVTTGPLANSLFKNFSLRPPVAIRNP
jgi:hypothetical protein